MAHGTGLLSDQKLCLRSKQNAEAKLNRFGP
ncbi:hypothetical protein A1S_3551 [Acinetobacter baumannii ATCC 17978]|nr:hypothetical protein A1S_3551 [Acinetobacter baumannii ATCC 17978]